MNSTLIPPRALTYVSLSARSERIIQAKMHEITTWELFTPHNIPPLVQIEELAPDVVVIDMTMDDWQPQCVLIEQIRGISPHTQIVALADDNMAQRIFVALQSGAIGYLAPHRITAEFLTVIEDTRQERGNLTVELARLILSHLPIFERFLEHERIILTAFAEGRNMLDVETYLDIPIEFLQRHIGNILLKVANPPNDAAIARATEEIATYHKQCSSPISHTTKHQRVRTRVFLNTFVLHFWEVMFPQEGNMLHRPPIKPWLKRAFSHLWAL